MNNRRVIPLFVLCFVTALCSSAQQYFTKSYTIENGLPTRSVNDACQEGNGTMWFATTSGISSYDGFCFTNYNSSNGLPVQQYRKVKFDETGILWGVPVRSCDTIVYMRNRQWTRVVPATLKRDFDVTAFDVFYKGGKPVVCLGTAIGLEIFSSGRWNHLDISEDSLKNRVLTVISKDTRFYATTNEGVWVVDQKDGVWTSSEFLKTPGQTIIAIEFTRAGTPDETLWMLSSDRITCLQHGKLTVFAGDFILPVPFHLPVSGFLDIDNNGNVFFGSNWAKYYVDWKYRKVSPLMINNGFSSNGAASVFIDREQNIWFTDSRGIDKISNLLLTNYFEINGLLENEVTAAVELSDGRLVFGHNDGLSVYDHSNFKRIPFPGSTNHLNRVQDMMRDDRDNVWFAATNMGFGKLMTNGSIKWYKVGASATAASVHQDIHGKIWLGTNKTLYYLQNDKLVAYEHNDQLHCPIRKIFSRRNGDITGVGIYGMFIISGNGVKSVPVENDVKTQSFYTYCKTRSGVEYVGTLNGLCVIENGCIRKFNKNGIRIDGPVYFILEDRDGNFWLGSNNGVFKWDGKSKLETYDLHTGLAGRETNRSAGIVDSRGNVWIGTDLGLSCFLSGFSETKRYVPSVELLDFEDNRGNRHSFNGDCTIDFNDNSLYFHFRGISFVNEDQIQYRYKLEGVDKDWQTVNQENLDKVKYAGIQPGHYRFMVQARNHSGEWSAVEESGVVTIRPPVFHTWWFNIIILLVVSTIIFGLIKIFLQWKYNRQLENEITERKRSEQKTKQTLQALHLSELKYRELIEFAVDGILISSKDKTITGANTFMQKLTGRKREELIGIPVDELFREEHLREMPLRYDLVENGEMVVSHREILQTNGNLIPVEMHSKMMPDGSYQSIFHDITSRKEAEANLRISRELYKLITDKMTDVVWLMNLEGISTFVSPSIEQFTGFSVDEYMKQSLDDRFTPHSAIEGKLFFEREINRLKAQPEKIRLFNYTMQMEYICRDGGTKWGELLITPYFGVKGEWLGIHGVTRDITGRKKLEDELRASEEKFVKAFQNSPDPFAITRLHDGMYLDINESYLRHSGYSREEMVGKNFMEVNVWASLEDRLAYTVALKEKGRVVNFETRYRTKSGEIRHCIASGELIDLNGERCILAIIHDITDRIQAEEALKEKANELERFNSLMIGRELRMIELKKEVNELLVASNLKEKYKIHE